MIGITFALPAESAATRRLLTAPSHVALSGAPFLRGELHGKQVAVLHTGVGAKVCRNRIEKFLASEDVRCLLSAGFAGALTDELAIGDLLLAENFSEGPCLASARSCLTNAKSGKLWSAPNMIDATTDRRQLAASSGAAAVDMETGTIAQACKLRGIPLLALRAISDTPALPFPLPPQILFDLVRQKTDFGRLGLYLMRHPMKVVSLIRFARRVEVAQKNLARAIDQLIASKAV